jgi:hypothetical protein
MFSKCEFWLKKVSFLGHIISKGVISVDPSKIQDVLSWNVPTSVGDIQSFVGWLVIIRGSSKDSLR